jgi:hypothetical protein
MNASENCEMLSEAYERGSMKTPCFIGIYGSTVGRMSKSQLKIISLTFFDVKGTIHFEFISQDQTVNQAYYIELLKQLRETELWTSDWILHFDIAPTHKVLPVKQFLAQK